MKYAPVEATIRKKYVIQYERVYIYEHVLKSN